MHAYAADDPVFLAMNERGQRETDGALGDLCVGCHAPVAVALGKTDDGLNLAELAPELRGVTCFACHQVDSVGELHNNDTRLALDNTMRGGIDDPVLNPVHASRWSSLHDRDEPESSDMCGSCHDVVLDNQVHLERTHQQWDSSLYANLSSARLSCAACHLPGSDGQVVPGGPERRVHDHSMPGVDIAITEWPQREAQRAAVQAELDTTLLARLCVAEQAEGALLLASLDNVAAGHNYPSGAAHDRRSWAELVAYSGDEVVWSVGTYADDEIVPKPAEAPGDLWQFRDVANKANGETAHMFWEVDSLSEHTLQAPVTFDPSDPDFLLPHVTRQWALDRPVDRVTMRVRIRPIGLDVLDDLIASGDLAPGLRDEMPVFDLGATVLEWTPSAASTVYGDFACVP
jgi:hypothetical protein